MDLRTTSKVELHRHLEGAIRLQTVFDLSRQAGLPLPADSPEGLARYALIREPVDSLEEALRAFAIAQSSVRTYDAGPPDRTRGGGRSTRRGCPPGRAEVLA